MSHFYDLQGVAHHFVPKKDGSGNRASTIRDAKANNWVPGVTTVLQVLHKPGLQEWLIRTAVHAVVTAPDLPGEGLDAKISRVLDEERQQDQEAQIARDLGTDLHSAMEVALQGRQIDEGLRPWIEPALLHIKERWRTVETEVVVIGKGYGGRVDFIGECDAGQMIVDFKTTKKLPEKGSYLEHKLQLSAYAACVKSGKPIQTANCYISTVDCGKFALHINPPWQEDYERGFRPLVNYWQWMTGYIPSSQ